MLLQSLREELVRYHLELPRNNLVAWTSGNISALDSESGLIAIKSSGVKYDEMSPESITIVNIDGEVVDGEFKPSSDTLSHCYIYRHKPDVMSIVHTHSRFATAFAALGIEIPCVLTAMGDEFGGAVPCSGFALIGSEEIGREIVHCLNLSKSPAVLIQNHGVFTIGDSIEAAVKAAVMVEDVAGEPMSISQEDVDKLHHRYTHGYGQ
jgi:L-ribulose-5-phosphate 4-epimerase